MIMATRAKASRPGVSARAMRNRRCELLSGDGATAMEFAGEGGSAGGKQREKRGAVPVASRSK
jgi:hypothetical protein